MPANALCVHAHFFQPMRSHPHTNTLGAERSAAPFRNWNERMTELVYRRNAALGNFDHLSFDMSESLLDWLYTRSTETYQRITHAVRTHRQLHKAPNVLAVPVHQSPLPLLSRRDRLTQLRWGRSAVKARFGVEPRGVFLPDFAVDYATLQSVVDAGYAFTVLRSSQVDGLPRRGGAGPYRIMLPTGDSIMVFVADDTLSTSMQEDLEQRCGAGFWARQRLGSNIRHAGKLTLLYVDGERLGHNKMGEPHFIEYLLTSEAKAVSYQPCTLESYFNDSSAPVADIELLPYEYKENPEQRQLRSVLDELMTEANLLFVDVLGSTAWAVRDQAYESHAHSEIAPLLESQVKLQQAWAGISWLGYYPELTVDYPLGCAAQAINSLYTATGVDLSEICTSRLNDQNLNIFRSSLELMQNTDPAPVGAGTD